MPFQARKTCHLQCLISHTSSTIAFLERGFCKSEPRQRRKKCHFRCMGCWSIFLSALSGTFTFLNLCVSASKFYWPYSYPWPIHEMIVYLPHEWLIFNDFYGKCRLIYHTWILYGMCKHSGPSRNRIEQASILGCAVVNRQSVYCIFQSVMTLHDVSKKSEN